MSEVGRQLVENEQKRKDVLRDAKRLLLAVLVKLSANDEAALAELDVDGAKLLLEQLAAKKQCMKNLRKERGELSAAASTE